jgi:ligand-binding sensor domain-containing protein/signal transduction histidine kinase
LKPICVLFILLFGAGKLLAQPFSFNHLQVESGLSNNSVLCSLQDDKGFLWFGTKDGLNRFDGYAYKIFRNNADVSNSIGSNIIYALHQDKYHVLWIGTERGMYCYNPLSESFSLLKVTDGIDVTHIQSDSDGNLWFIGRAQLYKYNKKTNRVTFYKVFEFPLTTLCITKNNIIWVSMLDGSLIKLDVKGRSSASYNLFSHSPEATSKAVQTIFDADNGQLFIGTTNQGVKAFDTQTNTYTDLITYNAQHDELFVRDFIKQTNNQYWIATESGIYVYNTVTKKCTVLTKQYDNPYSLSDNAVYTFCMDKEGGIWAGTYFGGLNYYAKPFNYFEKFFPGQGDNSLTGNAVREIHADSQHNLWIGTEDAGLNKFDIVLEKFYAIKPLGAKKSMANMNVHGLLVDGDKLWIGTFEHGLDVIDIQTRKVTRHFSANSYPYSLKSNFIYSLYKTRAGNILACTGTGIYSYSKSAGYFIALASFPDNKFYTSIYEDAQGTIWAGTYRDGLYYHNPATKVHGVYINNPGEKTSLPNNRINNIFEDSGHHMWFATEEGLCTFAGDNKGFIRYTTKNGLLSNVIYTMLEDDYKNLWISTSKGLACFNIVNKSISVYTKANGLLSDQFNYNSAYKGTDGTLYFGCLKGMIRFNPEKFKINKFMPPVYITGFQVNNKELAINKNKSPLKRSILYIDTIVLNYTQSSFSIDFAALGFTSPQMTQYAYKMEGLDKDWTYIRSNRKAYFTKLNAGTYIFNVKGSNSSKVWSNHTKRLVIIITPPFWASYYAYGFYLLSVILLIYAFIRRNHRHIEEKNRRKILSLENEKKKEIYEAKIAFFTHVAHEIRTPLTLISGPLERVIKKVKPDTDTGEYLKIMARNTDRLLTLTNQLLDFRKTETHDFSLSFVKTDIVTLIKDNLLRFSPAIEVKNLTIDIVYPKDPLFAYTDVEALHKILSNLLDNAIKYASGKIRLKVFTDDDSKNLTILISNDGYTIPYAMKDKIFETFFRLKSAGKEAGTGIGLPLARYLAELHKGTLTLQQSSDGLNTFALIIPVHQDIEFNI